MGGQYNWRNRLLLDLPMRMRDHDPVAGLSVNRGRAGPVLDAAFGAGAAEPSKLTDRKGYYFNNNDYMQCSAGYALTTGVLTAMLTYDGIDTGASDRLFAWLTAAGDIVCEWRTTATELRFYTGSVVGAANAARVVIADRQADQRGTILGVYDGTDVKAYVNGKFVADAATPVAPASSSNPMTIGANTDFSGFYDGNIYQVGLADFAATPSQAEQYHREQMEELHLI